LKLLEAVFLVLRSPAWGTTLGSRVGRQPKVHLVDSGVMAWLLRLTPEKIDMNDPAVLMEYGHLVETFSVGDILRQVSWSDAPVSPGIRALRARLGARTLVDGVVPKETS